MMTFTGKPSWLSVMKSPINMLKPPSPERKTTWRTARGAGKGGLRADALRRAIAHGAVIDRADQAALAVHRHIPRGPDRGRPDIGGEDRVLVGELAHQPGQILGM